MPSTSAAGCPGSRNARYVIAWRRARWRMRCHVRSFPPLSSGSSRSDFSHRMRMGQRLNPFLIDERAVPQLEVEQAPDAIAAFGAAGRVIGEQAVDRLRIENSPLARAAVEEHVARDAVPAAARPVG